MIYCYIGLGSNLEHPIDQVTQAFDELAALPKSRLINRSSLYRSKPVGPQDQPDFINAVAKLETELEPIALLDHLQQIEQAHHRKRLQHWGPRTLDLDLLLYGDQQIETPRLTVPHTQMTKRAFVLVPLRELDPQILVLQHPIDYWLAQTGCDELSKLP
jgi:2-amino-4-hydroxy-6-hydroxymethyldihydropteridine diphosphokinase